MASQADDRLAGTPPLERHRVGGDSMTRRL